MECEDTATACCAIYDADGRMMGIETKAFGGKRTLSFDFDNGNFASAKVFLLGDSSAPLCENKGA